ncbi:MAG: hypothetical protein WC180_05445 [Candidatus Paceibacterota bacterium]
MDDEKKQSTVYVGENDEIIEIIDKIKDVLGKNVTLMIPDESVILQDVTNLKILQKKAEEMGKEISISRFEALVPENEPEMRATLPDFSAKSQTHVRHIGRSVDGARPMSDMTGREETVDLRNFNREELPESEPEQPRKETTAENLVREKYYSDETYKRVKEADKPVSEEKELLPALDDEKSYRIGETEDRQEKDEAYWEKLAEKKMAEMGESAEKVEGIFDDRGRLDGEYDTKSFDFSYPEINTRSKKKKFSLLPTLSSRFFAIFIFICILTAGIALFFILPKADIAVVFKEEKVAGDFTLILDEKLSDIDVDASKVPVKTTEIKSEKTQAFVTTSKKRITEKATGNIIIYNECSTGPQTLVAGTRFLSKDGKIFKITAAVNIAGFTKPEDEVVAGTETVDVIAEEAGETYNIAATSFTIPKLQEQVSWKYSCLYAKSEQPMTGGLDEEVFFVSQADYDKAKATLLALAQKENEEKVAGQTSDDAIFFSNQTDEGTVEEKSSVEVGGVADSFDLTLSVKRAVLSIAKTNVEEILGKKILALNTFANALPVAGSLDYEVGGLIDKDKQLSVDVSASQNFAFDLDQDKVKQEIAGKDKSELNDYFSKMSGINSVSVNFWPFWVNRVPDSADKINISLSGA